MAELLWWHRAGQRVVCVSGKPPGAKRGPERGATYTVRDVVTEHVTETAFRLEELRHPPIYCISQDGVPLFAEPCYSASRFRPVRETSIEQFRVLLNPTPERRNIFDGMPEVEHV